MKLVVGFLTYNEASAQYLKDFLSSLKDALVFLDSSQYRVLAFDNSDLHHRDNLLALEKFNLAQPDFVEYLSAGENLGFSRAYNILIRRASDLGADYFLVINPDTYLEKSSIFRLINSLDLDSSLGSVSPKIRRWDWPTNTKTGLIDSCGLVAKPGLRFIDLGQGQADNKQFDRSFILGPSGAAGLFRLTALKQLTEKQAFFDENFFMYKEDCDLAYRLFKLGWKSKLVPEAIIYHDRTVYAQGQNFISRIYHRSKKSNQVRSWSFINQHFLFIKHWSSETIFSKIIIICQIWFFLFFSLILEQFLLKDYKKIFKFLKLQKSID